MLYRLIGFSVLPFPLACFLLLNPRRQKEEQVRRDDLLKPDLLSECLLLGSCLVMVCSLLLLLAAALR